MIKVVIGSMVLCHLLVPGQNTQNNTEENAPIVKVLGQVVDLQKGSRYIEKVGDKEALRVDRDIIIVKGQNKEGLYQVDARACMLVRDETPAERENRLFPKVKVEAPTEEKVELTEEVLKENKKENTAGIEIQNKPAVDEIQEESISEELKKLEQKKVEEVKVPEKVEVKQPEVKKEELKVKEIIAPEVKKEEPKKELKTDTKEKSLLDYIK